MMCAEEVFEIAKKIKMPVYMYDTDSALFWLSRFAKAAETPSPEANARWTPTHQNGSVVCAPPPCWLLIDDVLNPERDPWMTYWDGSGSPINCTSYRIIGYYETPPPPKDASGVRPQNTHEGDKP